MQAAVSLERLFSNWEEPLIKLYHFSEVVLSFQISDWRFPYKKSNHPVCVHYGRNRSVVKLRHCEEGANPSAARYEYLEAAGCKCQQCSSSDTSCEGLRYRPQRSHPASLGFRIN
ncbi:hypothetical protein Zmor_026484 [Zophobas morio]|uniref:Glycoprotein hormone subunit beta domain-containing protein n=1 Tax=Zophobas morio TaxID=2755281 RepID=A0AA38HVN3_9CUCU|nr:hypothetical protein Zmor_026484 [Zophobas morio]